MKQKLKFSILFVLSVMLFTTCKTLDRVEQSRNEDKQVAQSEAIQNSSKKSDAKGVNTFAKQTNEESQSSNAKQRKKNNAKHTQNVSYSPTIDFFANVKKGKNYNPYQYIREEHLQTCLEIRQEKEFANCEVLEKEIKRYSEVETEKEKYEVIRQISFNFCPNSFDFLVDRIKNDTSETNRCNAMMMLAWKRNTEYIPVVLDYAQKENLSIKEKSAIATAFIAFGIYTSHPELLKEAVKLLDEICYEAPPEIIEGCIWNYYNIGGESAIDFFSYYLNKEESRLSAAIKLAQLGEHKTTFPVFVDAINSGNEVDIHMAMYGLAAIGTEDAFKLIKEQTKSENDFLARRAKGIFEYIEMRRGRR